MSRILCGRLPGIHLNENGIQQAARLGEALNSRYALSGIVSSPLERALETAEGIQEITGVSLTTDEDLLELEYGTWTGMAFDEIRDSVSWQHYNRTRSTSSPPNGESMIAVQLRAWRAIERILERFPNPKDLTMAVVTHGDVIRSLLLLFLGMPIDYIHRLTVSPCSVSEVVFDQGTPNVLRINQNFYE